MSSRSLKTALQQAGRAGCAILAGAIASAGAIGIASVQLARRSVIPVPGPQPDVVVQSVTRVGSRLIARLEGTDVELPGRYSLFFDEGAGHARLGEIISKAGEGVAREIVSVDSGTLRPGAIGFVNGWWYPSPDAVGLRWERIIVSTELGDTEAWVFRPKRARKGHWAVHVHGRGGLPEETLRGVRPLAKLGITSMVISYRNDPGGPAGFRGRYGMGISEARDVDAAIAEAVRRGAERVTLVGWSMGGTASLIAAADGEQRSFVDGLVLDSPAIDWDGLLRYQAGLLRVPAPVTRLGLQLLDRGLVAGGEPGGIDFRRLTPQQFAEDLGVPVLIHASRGDTFVPSDGAEAFAAARPDLVQLRLTDTGEHVRIWNVDSAAWEHTTRRFVRWLPRPAWRG